MARYLRATYTTTVLFEIPEGVQADQYNTDVKWNTLSITQDDGTVLEIEAENEPHTDWKYPNKEELLDEHHKRIE